MMSKPFFTLIIPAYNRAHLIAGTIRSVLQQTYQNFELMIIDDGSTDDTPEVVASIKDERIKYFRINNSERGAARNAGAHKASGQYLNFIDSDDVLYPQHLETASRFIEHHQTPPIFHLGFDVREKSGKLLRKSGRIRNINERILSGNILSCNGVIVRRDVMLANLFNSDRVLAALEDWELWIRMAARYPFLHVDEITSSIIQHDGRSVMTQNISSVARKVDAFINAVKADDTNQRTFGKKLNRVYASASTYAALHIVIHRDSKKIAWKYLMDAISLNPSEVLKKRVLVIMKMLLVN
jgi:glycosyltransferase involved in cell wall biosynthesis